MFHKYIIIQYYYLIYIVYIFLIYLLVINMLMFNLCIKVKSYKNKSNVLFPNVANSNAFSLRTIDLNYFYAIQVNFMELY